MRRNNSLTLVLLFMAMAKTESTDDVDNTTQQVFPTDETKASSMLQDCTQYVTEHVVYTDTSDVSYLWSGDSHHYRDSVIKNITSPSYFSDLTEIPAALYFHNKTFRRLETVDVDLLTCVIRSQTHQVEGLEGSISMSLRPTSEAGQDHNFVNFCNVELTVPPGMVAYVKVLETHIECSECIRIILRDHVDDLLFDEFAQNLPANFYTYSSSLKLLVKMMSLRSNFYLLMNFSALPETSRPQLLMMLTSSTTGYLETPFRANREEFSPFIKSSVHLVAPVDHVVVISFHDIQDWLGCVSRLSDHLIFHTNSSFRQYLICSVEQNGDLDFYPGEVYIEYRVYSMSSKRQFRIMFSFHHLSALPVKLSEGRWNCSAVRWEDMQHHFPCNFVSDCVGGEDEAGCWSGDGTCSAGQVEVDGRCFSITHVVEEDLSWNDANRWCQERKQQLASLTTRTVWDFFIKFLKHSTNSGTVFIGARLPPISKLPIYRMSWLWCDGTVAHFIQIKALNLKLLSEACARTPDSFMKILLGEENLMVTTCEDKYLISLHLCEIPETSSKYPDVRAPDSVQPRSRDFKPGYILCPANHFTHVFLACDVTSNCWSKTDGATYSCSPPLTSLPPLFECADVQQSVPYTLVCDHRADCLDGSDENFCVFPPCDLDSPFQCSGRRCVQVDERCNGQVDCDDQADETNCEKTSKGNTNFKYPLRIDINSKGQIVYNPLPVFSCSDSDFVCPSLHDVCLPVYFRCNGVNDCPGHEDEAACDRYTCPGFYRCRKSQVCVHESHVCDGIYHCPQHDDEILCNETCPDNCVCHGWSFICFNVFDAAAYSSLRYLDASGTSMTLGDLENNTFLVYLSLARCNLTEVHEVTLLNLRTLDLSNNELTELSSSHFAGLKNLEFLKISHNPLTNLLFHNFNYTSALNFLDMSDIHISKMDFSIFAFFSKLSSLNLSGSHINHVTGRGFANMSYLRVLNLQKCPLTVFPQEIFEGLDSLETVFADNYKLCCPATLPRGFNVLNCHAPSDEVSSCDDLLRSNLYRVALAIFASLSLVGNLSTLVYRLILHKTTSNVGYDVFVTNLCVADFLMGVYLLIIGIADHRYKGVYLWEDTGWRNSGLCNVAGVFVFLVI
ncbi:uncharacterized protein LOC112555144 [Pomacea canaliculata]|uniref:uncharacterized protein LOC112555144 n=1 Tax=Pomacea canaliculata TaxID=400727 RepID=UPI000D727441|nr:uncharacterized protein LOC112555144 [Pomacea canaliculata]